MLIDKELQKEIRVTAKRKIAIVVKMESPHNLRNQGVFINVQSLIKTFQSDSVSVLGYDFLAVHLPRHVEFICLGGSRSKNFFKRLSLSCENLYYFLFLIKQLLGPLQKRPLIKDKFDALILPFPTWTLPCRFLEKPRIFVYVPDLWSLDILPVFLRYFVLKYIFKYNSSTLYWTSSFRQKNELVNTYKKIFSEQNTQVVKHFPGLIAQKESLPVDLISLSCTELSYVYYPTAYRERKAIEDLCKIFEELYSRVKVRLILTCSEHEAGLLNSSVITLKGQVCDNTHIRLMKKSLFTLSYSKYEASLPYVCHECVRLGTPAFCVPHPNYLEDVTSSAFFIERGLESVESLIVRMRDPETRKNTLLAQRHDMEAYVEKYANNFKLKL